MTVAESPGTHVPFEPLPGEPFPDQIVLDEVAPMAASPALEPEPAPLAARPPLRLRRLLIGVDAAAAALAWLTALTVPTLGRHAPVGETVASAALAMALTVVALALIAGHRLYRGRTCAVRAVEVARLGRVAAVSGLALLASNGAGTSTVSIGQAAAGSVLAFAFLVAGRGAYRSWLQEARRRGRFTRSVVIVGANEEGAHLFRLVSEHPEVGLRACGVIGDAQAALEHGFDLPVLGDVGDAAAAARAAGATGAIVAATALSPSQLNRVVRDLLRSGVHVHLSSGLQGIAHRRIRSYPLAHEPLLYLEQASLSRPNVVIKRALDVALAAVGLVLSLPVMAAAAVAVKLHDGGPVLFRQERVGRSGRRFTLYKLRTMVTDAEALLPALLERNERTGGPLFKLSHDPRVTPVGRLLRATSIDELPQLLNVLQGRMSLVGPRPALPSEVTQFDEVLQSRVHMPPGMTGLWQVEARDHPSFWAYHRLDLFYVENWSVGLDLAIMITTVSVVLGRVLAVLRRHRRAPQAAAGAASLPIILD